MTERLNDLVNQGGAELTQASYQLVAEWLRRYGRGVSLELGLPALADHCPSAALVSLSVDADGRVNSPCCFDLSEWPFQDRSVDLLVLHHCAYPGKSEVLFREAVRVLKPEGRLLVLGFNALGFAALRNGLWWERTCLMRGWIHALAQQQDLIWEQTLRCGMGSPNNARRAWGQSLPWWAAPVANLSAELFLKRRSNANVQPLRFRQSVSVGSPSMGLNRMSADNVCRFISARELNEETGKTHHRRRLQRQSRPRRLGRHPEARSA